MSHGVAARKRFGGVGFALGCGCKDPKAVAVAAAAVAASSPRSGTEASTATTATSRRARTHPSGSASTGTLTVPSASSSFLWEDADGDEVELKRPSSATTPSFSGLLRELRELEQSVKSSCARKSPGRDHFSPPPPPPPPPPLPPRAVQRRPVKPSIKEGHGNFSPPTHPPPPPPPPPPRPLQRRAVRSDDKPASIKEGQGDFSPPRTRTPSAPQVQAQQQHRRARSVDKVNRQEADPLPHFAPPKPPRPLPPPPPLDPLPHAKTEEGDGLAKKYDDPKRASTPPKHRKAKSCDASGNRLDGSVAVVKQSEDPLGDFRRSMLSMIVENGIVAGDELRELLRRFLALNAPRHHDAILRAFAEIWDEVFAAAPEDAQRREPACRQTAAPRQRTPPCRRQAPPAWRV